MTARNVKRVRLDWAGEGLVFHGGAPEGTRVTLDGDSGRGPSPMDALLLGLASCMGSDIVHILQKGRVPLDGLSADVRGERAEDDPRRYLRIEILFRASGPGPDDDAKLERALDLSRDTYCSFVHSLRSDMELDFRIARA